MNLSVQEVNKSVKIFNGRFEREKENPMSLDQNVVHRKVFAPWYDTDVMCAVTMVFAVLVILFCLAGISVGEEQDEFQNYIWIPKLLLTMSGALFISVLIRLVRRVVIRYQNRYLKNFSGTGL